MALQYFDQNLDWEDGRVYYFCQVLNIFYLIEFLQTHRSMNYCLYFREKRGES